MDSVKTKKGTLLPLVNLKGKSYLMVAHRLQWLAEEYENYTIDTEFLSVTDDQTVAKATICLYSKEGQLIRRATATKRETKKDFSDHTEKAETAACGRALAMLGMGTQHALSDLSEGERLADSPVTSPIPKTAFGSIARPVGKLNTITATEPPEPLNLSSTQGTKGWR